LTQRGSIGDTRSKSNIKNLKDSLLTLSDELNQTHKDIEKVYANHNLLKQTITKHEKDYKNILKLSKK
jgi:dimeric dUTPase (all-alpha-NTP-PPase superfamily)